MATSIVIRGHEGVMELNTRQNVYLLRLTFTQKESDIRVRAVRVILKKQSNNLRQTVQHTIHPQNKLTPILVY